MLGSSGFQALFRTKRDKTGVPDFLLSPAELPGAAVPRAVMGHLPLLSPTRPASGLLPGTLSSRRPAPETPWAAPAGTLWSPCGSFGQCWPWSCSVSSLGPHGLAQVLQRMPCLPQRGLLLRHHHPMSVLLNLIGDFLGLVSRPGLPVLAGGRPPFRPARLASGSVPSWSPGEPPSWAQCHPRLGCPGSSRLCAHGSSWEPSQLCGATSPAPGTRALASLRPRSIPWDPGPSPQPVLCPCRLSPAVSGSVVLPPLELSSAGRRWCPALFLPGSGLPRQAPQSSGEGTRLLARSGDPPLEAPACSQAHAVPGSSPVSPCDQHLSAVLRMS